MAQIIKTTGEVIEVSPKNGKSFELEELQAIVEHKVGDVSCHYIEIITMPDGRLMVVNEEGKLIGAPMNNKATDNALAKATGRDLLLELKRRGYEGQFTIVTRKTVDLSKLED